MVDPRDEDQRVRRTRAALLAAFNALVLSRRYSEIRVGDIVAAAGTARSTFYEHFRSKDDLLRQSLAPLVDWIAAGITPAGTQPVETALRHIWENRRLAGMLLRGPAARQLRLALADGFALRFPAELRRTLGAQEQHLVAALIAEGQVEMLRQWVGGATSPTALRMAALLVASARGTVQGIGALDR